MNAPDRNIKRAQIARANLEEEITKSNANAEQKTFIRQRVAHLWDCLVKVAKGGSDAKE